MKKIIVAICGIILAGEALAAGNDSHDPHIIEDLTEYDLKNAWKMASPWNYTKSVVGQFTLERYINNTWGMCGDDEGAIVAIIAHKIYKNGGLFCTTQIQSANTSYSWISYYKNEGYKCETICKSGWYGDTCDQKGYVCNPNTINYKEALDNVIGDTPLRTVDNRHCDDKPITNDIDVFYYKNGANNNTHSNVVLLGVLERKEHGVLVGPIQVNADRRNNRHSTISGVFSNGNTFWLCAPGYSENDNDCELSTLCGGTIRVCSDEKRKFDGSKHNWETKQEENGTPCKYIVCKSGYGLKPETEECIPCETTRKQGIKDGVCKQCDDNQIFKDGGCVNYKPLYAKDLIDGLCNVGKCWMESNSTDYHNCVFEKWDRGLDKCKIKNSE